MNNFITNDSTKNLKERLVKLMEKSEELKFLVGFFYFSGMKELYEGLKANPLIHLKILVGLNVDNISHGLIEYSETESQSDNEKVYYFFESIKKSINTDSFDTQEFYQQVHFFIDLIKNNKLIIRRTYEPNHAKLYIFKLDQSQVGKRELFITGSSNLTKAGLSTQNEFNVEISDYGFSDAEKYFDTLWENAIKITELDQSKTKLLDLIEKDTLVKEVTPFEAYCFLLKTYLDSFEEKEISDTLIKTLEDNNYKPYQYQLDAVKQALAIIENTNGVIIADVVGLGKTVVACAIAKQMKKRGIIICPPGLIGDKNKNSGWKKYTEEFKLFDWEVRSLGDLEGALKFVNKAKDIEAVIIDEAHRFRNQDTKDYELLKNICREKQVILLTATPFNNRPGDILSLIKLFITPKKSSITLESNLVDQFREFKGVFNRLSYIKKHWDSNDSLKRQKALKCYNMLFDKGPIDLTKVSERAKYLSKQIRTVIEPVTIRRNRLDLQNNPFYQKEVQKLSQVSDPKEWFFELTPEQSQFYEQIIESYFGDPETGGYFKGAVYRPFEYEKDLSQKSSQDDHRQYIQQRNLFDFMRRLIVKRFESSFGSFKESITNFKRITENCRTFIQKQGEYILDRSLLEKIYKLDEDEIENSLKEYEEKIKKGEYPKNHKRYKLKNFKYKKEFLQDIDSDIDLFDTILNQLNNLNLVKNDPKTACLKMNLIDELNKKPKKGEPKRKIIIFSEYLDTVEYLKSALENEFKRMLIVSGSLTSSKIEEINKNFDASYPKKEQKDDYDILIASDKLSEGYNLNRAGMIINYDIPWNPVRVIQRLGRINRISKKVFDDLYIVNFFPTEKGAQLVQSRQIAANKMFLIHSALGEDSKIFDIDEEPAPAELFQRIQKNPDLIEEESFYTKVLKDFLQIKKNNPQLIESLENFPIRIKTAKQGADNELLVFFKKGRLYVTGAKTDSSQIKPLSLAFEDVYDKIICPHQEPALQWNTDKFWQVYQILKEHKEKFSPPGEQSIEVKALNNISSLIYSSNENLVPRKTFLRTLREDILDYGTLSDFTMRRIANIKEKDLKEIDRLKEELGENYLIKEKQRLKHQKKEIITAIENKKI